MRSEDKRENGGSMWFRAFGSALIACALSVALVAAFAFVMMKQWFDIESAGIFNLAIKIICAAAAALLTLRGGVKKAWMWGAAGGGLYMLITTMVFSLLSGEFAFNTGILLDVLMCMLAGAVTGIVKNLCRG